ncbi:hypothetical protein F5B22DRAFT_607479 [Xylaria bambusicola]|uniref:uncharacterized protein n=1 Tax=Xylaria bambusicola TaxID=326684 RepID=UPI0020087AD1|nr:uncharacterized protein F5B22DRAFT_607479 [Xylaria bambusicola]KAI0515486.1 hypothetical protein F5B22DRAFT_607479 [Xylaria bambusicola]
MKKLLKWGFGGTDKGNRGKQPGTALKTENQSIVDVSRNENEDNAGLKFLYEPTEKGLSTLVDIVCIHGLSGHRETTWTATEPGTGRTVLWIKDFLPNQLPYARIMTYGYSSQVFTVRHLTQRTLYSQSKTLLAALKSVRQDGNAPNRPLIFISHSLGGLIAKSALIHANNDHVFKDILLCTAGMVFFGTPHQGIPDSDRSWVKIVSNLINHKINCSKMRNTMDSNLNWLQFQLEQYKSLDGSFPTYCFYEVDASGISQKAPMTTPRISAVPLELLNTMTLTSFPRQQPHDDLCKWLHEDFEFNEAMKHLVKMCEEARDLVRQNVVMYNWCRDPFKEEGEVGDEFLIPMSLPLHCEEPFLGRDPEIRAIHSYLSIPNELHRATLLGPGGVGKTQLALRYVYAYENQYSSVFWLDAQNRFTLHSSCLRCVERLKSHYVGTSRGEDRLRALQRLHLGGLIDEDGRIQSCQDTPELLFLVFKKWLEWPGNDRWLLIIDGVDQEPGLGEFHIDKFLDSLKNGHVIITSRSGSRGHTFNIQGLEPDDAMKLLNYLTAERQDMTYLQIRELVNQLERLPLAIQQAAAFLSRTQWSIGEYVNTLKSGTASHSSDTPILMVSVQHLDKKLVDLLNTIAFLSDSDVSVDLIKSGVQKLQSSTPYSLVESLSVLKRYSLIRYDSATQMTALVNSRWTEMLRDKVNTPDYKSRAKIACSSVSSYLESAIGGISSITYTSKQYRLEEELLPYMERCVNYIEVLSPEEVDWHILGHACRRQGRHDLAKQFYNQKITLRAELLLNDLHDMEYALGPTHIRTIRCADLAASQYQEEGEHAKAEIIWRRANSSHSRTLGDYHPLTLRTGARLALTLQQQGKYSQAKGIYSSVCNATAIVLGDEHPETLKLMTNVAMMYTLERRFDEADQEYRRALRKMEQVLGPDHEDVKKIMTYITLNNKQRQPNVGGVSEDFQPATILLDW